MNERAKVYPRDRYQAEQVIIDLVNAAARCEAFPDDEPSRRDRERAREILLAGFDAFDAERATAASLRERVEALATEWERKAEERKRADPVNGWVAAAWLNELAVELRHALSPARASGGESGSASES